MLGDIPLNELVSDKSVMKETESFLSEKGLKKFTDNRPH